MPEMLPAFPRLEFEAHAELSRTIQDLRQLAEGDRSALVMAAFDETASGDRGMEAGDRQSAGEASGNKKRNASAAVVAVFLHST